MITYKTGKGAILSRYRCHEKRVPSDIGVHSQNKTLCSINIWWPSIDAMIHGELTVDQTLEQMEVNSNQQVATMKEKYRNVTGNLYLLGWTS